MPRFKFQLAGVLEHRKNIEEEKQRALAAVLSEMQRLKNDLVELDQVARGAVADLRQNRLTGALDMSFLAAHRRFTGSVQRKALAIAQKMALVQRQIDEARAALAEAAKQRKIIEKLRERQLERWNNQQHRQEMDELEELLAKTAGRPAAEQLEYIQKSFDSQMAQLDRAQRELNDLNQQVEQARAKLNDERKALDDKEKKLTDREQQAQRLASDQGFQ